MADEAILGAGQAEATQAGQTGGAGVGGISQPSASDSAVPAASGVATGAPAGQQAMTPQQFITVLDAGRQLGIDVSQFQTDDDFLNHLFKLHGERPQLEMLARHGQEYIQNYDQYSQWLKAQQAQQQAAQQQQAPQDWWNPPAKHDEVKQLVARWYDRDPQTGAMRPRPDAPPSVIQKVADYGQYVGDWDERMRHDPRAAFGDLVREQAMEVVRQEMARHQAEQVASQIIDRNAAWMFQRDPRTGVPMPGVYTPYGLQFYQYVRGLEQEGVRDPYAQEARAHALIERDMLRAQVQQLQGQLRQFAPTQQTPQATQQPTPPAWTPPNQQHAPNTRQRAAAAPTRGGMNLATLFRQDLDAAGIREIETN